MATTTTTMMIMILNFAPLPMFLLLQSRNETVEMVKMVTFPTSESTQGEVKVSGSCLFNTTLPVETGRYGFYVVIYPGGRTYNAKLTGGFEWITNGKIKMT